MTIPTDDPMQWQKERPRVLPIIAHITFGVTVLTLTALVLFYILSGHA